MNIGSKITFYRKKKGISQRELGRRIDSTGQQISKIELGNGGASINMLEKIADALGVPVANFFEEEERINKKEYDLLLEENQMLKQLVKYQQDQINKFNH